MSIDLSGEVEVDILNEEAETLSINFITIMTALMTQIENIFQSFINM